MRELVHKVYLKYIPDGSSILELNAGTGVDAVFLAEQGYKIYATDISDVMIDEIQEKVKNLTFSRFQPDHVKKAKITIKAEALSFDEISRLPENNFDVVVSNFGGLNCINDFSKLSGDLAAKLKPHGLFIAVVMNKICPWEVFYYLLILKFSEAFRRFNRNGIMAELNGEKVLTYYFSPGEFAESFAAHFDKVNLYALANQTPPPYLIGIYNKLKPLVKLWMKIDELTMGLPVFNRFGDHFIIIMKKK